jgi:hypothetical protein
MVTWIWILIAIAIVIVIALLALGATKRRTAVLRERFGPEYDRTVQSHEDRRAAEADLRAREKQRAQFDIKPLPEATRLSFADEWRDVQERFVDQPSQAVAAADTLIVRVMEARGYPMRDFEAQADLVSVDHPGVVENYRFAHGMWQRSQTQQASTEDLRDALLRYRSLFDELLRPDGDGIAATTTDQADARQAALGATGEYPDGTGRTADEPGAAGPPDAAGPPTGDAYSDDPRMRRGGR